MEVELTGTEDNPSEVPNRDAPTPSERKKKSDQGHADHQHQHVQTTTVLAP